MYLCTCLCIWLYRVLAVAEGSSCMMWGLSLRSEASLAVARGLQSASAALLRSMWNLSSPDQGSIPRSLCWKVNS